MPNELTTNSSKDEAIPEELTSYLRADNIRQAINANLPSGLAGLPEIPKDYVFKRRDKEVVALSLHAAFELAGGVPYLVEFARQQPEKFLNLWVKLMNDDKLDSSGGVQINFNSPIPQNALDLVSVNEAGNVVTLDLEDDLPE